MLGTLRKSLLVFTGVALLSAVSVGSAAASGAVKAAINVRGDVTVNDLPAISNSTVVTGSTITTNSGSTAFIGIGINGRIELLPGTSIKLDYSDDHITAMLNAGEIRVTDTEGVATTVITPGTVVAADAGRSNTFSINSSGLRGSLTNGKLTVLSAKERVNVALRNGRVISLTAGESVVQDDDDDDDNGAFLWLGLGVFGAATAGALIYAFTRGDDTPQPFQSVSPFI